MENQINITKIIHSSYLLARDKPLQEESKGKLHKKRSETWIDTLAAEFKTQLRTGNDIRVFSKRDYSNRKDFGLNELLYDIVVCQVEEVVSTKQKKTLFYVREVLWQVESEFAKNSREALFDFNKFVLGNAHSKLFIGPQVADNESFIDVLLPAALVCQGKIFVALVPHPSSWAEENWKIDIWELRDQNWHYIN
jgi:hypothetical protein